IRYMRICASFRCRTSTSTTTTAIASRCAPTRVRSTCRLDPKIWATAEDGAWDLIDALEATRHYDLLSGAQARALTRRDPFERRVGALLQYRKPKKKSPRALARRKKGSVPIF